MKLGGLYGIGIKMKVEVVEKVENPILKRTEIKFKVEHTGAPTPKRLEVRAQLASLLGVAEDLLVIEKLAGTYGHQAASGIARSYGSHEQLKEIEPKYLLERGIPKEAKAEEPPEEKPKAEKAEKPQKEAKPEEKPKEAKHEKPKPEKEESKKEAKHKETPKEDKPKKPEKVETGKEDKTETKVKEKPKEEGKGGKGN